MIFRVYNSEHSKEDYLTLKYGMSMREFLSYKENVNILELYDAANAMDDHNEQNK